jgi:hypothetical protein
VERGRGVRKGYEDGDFARRAGSIIDRMGRKGGNAEKKRKNTRWVNNNGTPTKTCRNG